MKARPVLWKTSREAKFDSNAIVCPLSMVAFSGDKLNPGSARTLLEGFY